MVSATSESLRWFECLFEASKPVQGAGQIHYHICSKWTQVKREPARHHVKHISAPHPTPNGNTVFFFYLLQSFSGPIVWRFPCGVFCEVLVSASVFTLTLQGRPPGRSAGHWPTHGFLMWWSPRPSQASPAKTAIKNRVDMDTILSYYAAIITNSGQNQEDNMTTVVMRIALAWSR